jgi:hypothetical protein
MDHFELVLAISEGADVGVRVLTRFKVVGLPKRQEGVARPWSIGL